MPAIGSTFADTFGRPAAATVSVPGRVNLIGEHVDYTGGTVLPTPIPQRLRLAFGPGGETVRARSTRFDATADCNIDAPPSDHWVDYLVAGHRKAIAEGLLPKDEGGAYLVDSDIPHGAGVSSSAALLVAQLRAIAAAADRTLPPTVLARWAQEVERDDIGMPCGIMDQMAVAAGEPGFAMALDTVSLDYELIALPEGYAFPVIHSGLTRQLAEGAYKARRQACEAAAEALGLPSLEALSPAGEEALARTGGLPDPIGRRARHVITEHQRTLAAIDALRGADAARFGALMDESHASMRDDFEIVPEAMDEMADAARAHGALGARLTGGGFGGCFVALVPTEALQAWLGAMGRAFPGTIAVTDGLPPASRPSRILDQS